MAEFIYTAVGPDGKKKKGRVEAKTKEMAVANLKQEKNTLSLFFPDTYFCRPKKLIVQS